MSVLSEPAELRAGTVLVTGAGGFIGRQVCVELAQQGFTVLRLGHGLSSTGHATQDVLDADISVAALVELARDRDLLAVIHCAGTGSVALSYDAPLSDFQRTVASTASILEFVRLELRGHTRVVLASSAAVYGDQGDDDLVESAPRSPISPYGFNKVAAESLCDSYSRFFAVRASVVRLFSVYGEGLRKQLFWDAMNKTSRGEGEFFGTGRELRDWIHVSDAARLLCLAATAADQAPFEIYNGAHAKASTRSVLEALLTLASPTAVVPRFNGQTHAGNPRRLTGDCARAHGRLGWRPKVELAEGLARYASWFAAQAKR